MNGGVRRREEVKRLSLIERMLTLAFGDGFKLLDLCRRLVTNIKSQPPWADRKDFRQRAQPHKVQKHKATSDILAMLAPIDSH